jgi:hypothetical protein
MGYPAPFPLLPEWAVPFLAFGILASAYGLLMEKHRRWALVGLFMSALYVQGVDFMAAFTLNKLFVGVYGILLVCPGYEAAVDSGKRTICALAVRTVQTTLILQYFAAGLAKATEGDWLSGGDVLWGHAQGVYRTEFAAWMLRALPVWAFALMQHLSLAFELGAPLLFCISRLRPVAFIIGMGFHLMIALMMKDLIYFSIQMWTFYALFISGDEWRTISDWVRSKVLAWLHSHPSSSASSK